MGTRLFEKELLKSWGLPYGLNGGSLLVDDTTHVGRWTEYRRVVFQAPDDHKIYQVRYERGLTELQYHDPWDGEDQYVNPDGTIDGIEVEEFEVVTTQYRPKEES